ncbi:hypothetical protein SLEP1_g12642 [Rubroshorea leprosula]|uniref:Uncharacterized protein n=1 Tax=Rubroshorea leprosula TaxID=152421 RepID=A0AAV5IHN5_9ROSI|nr:hypothetical protein SLEP1_g12642 [Rubroshorea leprosula]
MPPASSPCQLRFACWNSGKLPGLLSPIYPCSCCLVLIGFLLLNCPFTVRNLLEVGDELAALKCVLLFKLCGNYLNWLL